MREADLGVELIAAEDAMTARAPREAMPGRGGTTGQWYFEDFAAGQRFTSTIREVTERDLQMFTEVSGDAHPVHTDPGAVEGAAFARPVLQGSFGIAVFAGLFHEL